MPVAAVIAIVLAVIGGLAVFGVIGLRIYEWIPSPSGDGNNNSPLDPFTKPIGGGLILVGVGLLAVALLMGRK